jgi:hypothetical protein
MRFFHIENSLFVTRNLWLFLLSKVREISNLVKDTSKLFLNYKDSKSVLILSLASVIAVLLEIL